MSHNDLNGNQVFLDYEMMLYTTKIAMGQLMSKIDQYRRELNDALEQENGIQVKLVSERLNWTVRDLQKVSDTYHVLAGAKEREYYFVVNTPAEHIWQDEKHNWFYNNESGEPVGPFYTERSAQVEQIRTLNQELSPALKARG